MSTELRKDKTDVAEKEPWQMTKNEFDGHPLASAKYVSEMVKLDRKGVNAPPREFMLRAATAVAHKETILQALAEGKPVPAEVLADYPDLTKAAESAQS
jgi:hypothetical protein